MLLQEMTKIDNVDGYERETTCLMESQVCLIAVEGGLKAPVPQAHLENRSSANANRPQM